ncbi:TetR/AcrR family transcriptional regulator [Dehalobacter sp. DCM]|uniref:TetR/AcrR family transcriptional regulator n=1 Tax=Dehalobacter sp. DCM TaxID=2907827 RepID=UPI003081E430|nr:TetR/AcrR family transcriptional regulator [Dehalobacter sp. DCM]
MMNGNGKKRMEPMAVVAGSDKDNRQAQRILNAALSCIAVKGYAEASLRDIADEAGVALSQLNYYFKNKEGLFNQVVKTLSVQYLREIESVIQGGKSKKERIHYLVTYFQQMLSTKPELFKLLFDLSSKAIWSESLRSLLTNLFNDMTRIIERLIFKQEDSERPLPLNQEPAVLARVLLGTVLGTSIQAMLAKGQDDVMDSLTAIQGLF